MSTLNQPLDNQQPSNPSNPINPIDLIDLKIPKICWLLCLIVAFTNLTLRILRNPLDHDELQHVHDAWLVFQHQIPYINFFEHHPPHYWYFLTIYFRLFGDNIGVFYWGRVWMLIAFAVAIFFTYKIGKELFGEAGGLMASAILCLNRYAQSGSLFIRPDGFMVALMLAGVYVFIKSWQRKFLWYESALAGLLLGAAFSIHPRSGFTIIGLGVAVLCGWSTRDGMKQIWQRKQQLVLFVVASVIPIILPFLFFGVRLYANAVYYVSARVTLPHIAGWEALSDMLSRTFALFPLIFISIGVCIYEIVKDRDKNWLGATALWLGVFHMSWIVGGTTIFHPQSGDNVATSLPPVHVFYVFMPSIALLTARGGIWLIGQLSPKRALIGLSLFFMLGVVSNLRPEYWQVPNGLAGSLAYIEQLNAIIPKGERFAGPTNANPMFRFDGSYYWFDFPLAILKEFQPTFHHDFIAEFEQTKPLVVHRDFIYKIDFDPAQAELMKAYLAQHYHPIPELPGLMMRN